VSDTADDHPLVLRLGTDILPVHVRVREAIQVRQEAQETCQGPGGEVKAEERPRCPELFLLLAAKGGTATTSQCLFLDPHKGAHKAKIKGGVVRWKRRRRPAEASNDEIVKAAVKLAEQQRHVVRKHSAGRVGKKPHGDAAYRLDRGW
jgi:hypothetical protein